MLTRSDGTATPRPRLYHRLYEIKRRSTAEYRQAPHPRYQDIAVTPQRNARSTCSRHAEATRKMAKERGGYVFADIHQPAAGDVASVMQSENTPPVLI